jgi:molecular chaperone GrpE
VFCLQGCCFHNFYRVGPLECLPTGPIYPFKLIKIQKAEKHVSNEEQTTPDVEENLETTDAPEAAASDAPEADDLQAQVESLSEELATAKDQAVRAQAEVQNVRRRAEQDVEKAHKFGQEKLVNDLLPIIDNLERALESINADDEALKAIVEGVELTLKSFQDTLSRHNVEAINPVGEPFDPQSHQAMSMVESPDAEPNTVLNVFQKGYSLHGRLVRPAMVVVAKAPA